MLSLLCPQWDKITETALRYTAGLLISATALLAAGSANAATIYYEAEPLPSIGLNERWRYTYTLENTDFDPGEGFTIVFSAVDYVALAEPSAPDPDWNAIVLQPDLLLPDHGYFDAQAQVAAPSNAGSFSVVFDWLGTGTPGPQPYELYDTSFDSVEQGVTTIIPDPSTALLMVVGLIGLGIHGRQPRRKADSS